ncbi:hypothetical protein [Flavobacterium sp.]|uniref:hypothetical protein n=1 Tax=Flavobacterium sp. TaxID=239 RepID=UPI003C3F5D48
MKIVYKSIVIGFFCTILTIIQGYLSMGQYANEISSGCIDCSFNEVLIKYAIVLIFLPTVLMQLLFNKIFKKQYVISIIIVFFLTFVWLKIINADVFETRVSSWSSFSTADIDTFVFMQSYKSIIICISLYLLFTLMLNKYTK